MTYSRYLPLVLVLLCAGVGWCCCVLVCVGVGWLCLVQVVLDCLWLLYVDLQVSLGLWCLQLSYKLNQVLLVISCT